MDFCDNDAPWGDVGRVQEVLALLAYVTTLPMPNMQPGMRQEEWEGLCWILLTCKETLKKASQRAKE